MRRLDHDVQVGQPVLDRLEPAHRAAELLTVKEIRNSVVQAPLRDAQLLRGQQRGPQLERIAHRGVAGFRDGYLRRARAGEIDVGELPGHVQGDDRLDADPCSRSRDLVQLAVSYTHLTLPT